MFLNCLMRVCVWKAKIRVPSFADRLRESLTRKLVARLSKARRAGAWLILCLLSAVLVQWPVFKVVFKTKFVNVVSVLRHPTAIGSAMVAMRRIAWKLGLPEFLQKCRLA